MDWIQIGVDEAGVGCLMGDMVACACHIPEGIESSGFVDSKTISHKKRKLQYDKIMECCVIGIGVVTSKEIDDLGMAKCRRLVMKRAIDEFSKKKYPDHIIVDGKLFDRWEKVSHECHDKADQKFECVSAASIVAKVTRDEMIDKICEEHPDLNERYKWKQNKGYGTKDHREGIQKFGATEFHRHSFTLVKS